MFVALIFALFYMFPLYTHAPLNGNELDWLFWVLVGFHYCLIVFVPLRVYF